MFEQMTLAEAGRRSAAGIGPNEPKHRCDACGRDLRRPDEKRKVFQNERGELLCGTCHSELDRHDIRIIRQGLEGFPGVRIRWPRGENPDDMIDVSLTVADIVDALEELRMARIHLAAARAETYVPELGEHTYKCRDRIEVFLSGVGWGP